MSLKEIEFKYCASNISLKEFEFFCTERGEHKYICASGYDHFYAKAEEPDTFYRHRVGGPVNQLSFKRKTDSTNNYIRTEYNIDLSPKTTFAQVADLCGEFGYTFTNSIFKNCFIYQYEWYTLSYYIVYDVDMVERGRFIEIEMKEDYKWNTHDAWTELVTMEKLCKPLGLLKENRIAESIFELYGLKSA